MKAGQAFCVLLVIVRGGNIYAGQNAKARVLEICRTLTDDSMTEDRLFTAMSDLGEEGRKALLDVASSKKPDARCALQYLHRLEDRRAIPIARRILNDPKASDGMKEEALYTIGTFKDTASFDKVMDVFCSSNQNLIKSAAYALKSLGDERGLRALREALSDPLRAGVAVSAVGVKGHQEAVDPLLELLNKNPAMFEKGYGTLPMGDLILSLGRIATSKSRRASLDLVPRLKDERFRQQVIKDLWVMFESQRAGSHDPSEVAEITGLMATLKDDSAAPAWIKERWLKEHPVQ